MVSCESDNMWPVDESLLKFHIILDVITAMALFTIPLELIYFSRLNPMLPRPPLFMYIGILAILCGATYLANVWSYSKHSVTPALVIMVVKVSAAAFLWRIVVIWVLPNLERSKQSVHALEEKIRGLCGEKHLVSSEVALRRSCIQLTREIRSTLDWRTVVESTIVGLHQIFELKECALWFPSQTNRSLQLLVGLNCSVPVGSSIPEDLPDVSEVFRNSGAVRISCTSPLVGSPNIAGGYDATEIIAVRVPLPYASCNNPNNGVDGSPIRFAVLILALPSDRSRKFHDYELKLVDDIAEQVTIAFAHSLAVEDPAIVSDCLSRQNSHMERELQVMKSDLCSSKDSLSGVLQLMSTPLLSVTSTSSRLLESELTAGQRGMVVALLESSDSLAFLMDNEIDLNKIEEGSVELSNTVFKIFNAFMQVIDLINPAAAVKNLSISLTLDPKLPADAVGDAEILKKMVHIVVRTIVKYAMNGSVSVRASLVHPTSFSEWRPFNLCLLSNQDLFYLQVQVEYSGCEFDEQERAKFQAHATLGCAISNRLLVPMGGRVWLITNSPESSGEVTFIVKLGVSTQATTN